MSQGLTFMAKPFCSSSEANCLRYHNYSCISAMPQKICLLFTFVTSSIDCGRINIVSYTLIRASSDHEGVSYSSSSKCGTCHFTHVEAFNTH